ncbi:MAG: N-acetyl sugar amidotransferase [Bacteroidota bacterium]
MKEVIVNGKKVDIPYQICLRCVQDSSVPGIKFDTDGVCNFCHLHDKIGELFPNDERGNKVLSKVFDRIRRKGFGKKYDCVVGISGGRDSIYMLYLTVKKWGLRPIAVHFNDGFDNPIAGENMVNACRILGVELRTITSDWREGKELKIDFLKASTPDLNMGTDIGIASSLYGVAAKENIKYILIGQSFRTEGVKPLSWSFFDGDYLRTVHNQFGNTPLRKWTANDPGFNFGIKELFYYSVIRGIHTILPMYNFNYVRKDAEEIIIRELEWVYPGAHYYDDLYHSLIKYVHRIKFNIDLNMNSDSALVRSGQLSRELALERAHGIYAIEDPKVIELCVKRLGLTMEEFSSFMELPPKTFRDYKTSYNYIRLARYLIKLLSWLHLLPKITYYKYFYFGK